MMEYDDLPMTIRSMFTRKEWEWMPDDEKARTLDQEVEPDYVEDLTHAA